MKRLLSVLGLICLTTTWTPADSPKDTRCQTFMAANPDLVCLSLADARALDIKVVTLSSELAIEKAKARAFTGGCTLGPYLGGAIDQNLTWHWTGGPVALDCGLTVRFSNLHLKH